MGLGGVVNGRHVDVSFMELGFFVCVGCDERERREENVKLLGGEGRSDDCLLLWVSEEKWWNSKLGKAGCHLPYAEEREKVIYIDIIYIYIYIYRCICCSLCVWLFLFLYF